MTLQSSGPISLSQVNAELGLSSSASISLGSASVRGLAGVASGAISMSNLYGKSNVLDTQSVYVGQTTVSDGKTYFDSVTGYSGQYGIGSISDGTSNVYGGATFYGIYHYSSYPVNASLDGLYLYINGILPSTGWNTMKIGTTIYSRANCFSSTGSGRTYWVWPGTQSNPFSAVGSNTTVTFA